MNDGVVQRRTGNANHTTRCPRCFRANMKRGDGSMTPHRRPSNPDRTGMVMVWCKPHEELKTNRAGGGKLA